MSDDGTGEGRAFGTAEHSAPVTRADFERAIRGLHMSDVELKDSVIKLAAHVIALTDELTRRIDGVEPMPAPPNTPAPEPTHTVEQMVAATLPHTLDQIRAHDVVSGQRVSIDAGESKYDTQGADVPCAELMHLCHARCCKMTFALSTLDLDEGVIRWDYGQPYLIRQRASDGFCVHNDPTSHGCTVHEFRPRVCRSYDCRNDARVWEDYDNRIPAPQIPTPAVREAEAKPINTPYFELLDRVRARQTAVRFETATIAQSFSDHGPTVGPKPTKGE